MNSVRIDNRVSILTYRSILRYRIKGNINMNGVRVYIRVSILIYEFKDSRNMNAVRGYIRVSNWTEFNPLILKS